MAALLRSRLARLGATLVLILLGLGLLIVVAPDPVARYLLTNQLDDLGIDHSGSETLDVDLWRGEVRLGPVRFGVSPTAPGQLGELSLKVRFTPLAQRRLSIERLSITGVDVLVRRTADGAIVLNGIPLTPFLAGLTTAGAPPGDDDGWDAGIDVFELRDSRLLFERAQDRELEIVAERLRVTELQNWAPSEPLTFELVAHVNDIRLNWSGQARPFAEEIVLDIDSHTDEAEAPKVLRFTGPAGLDRRGGEYDARLRHQATLSPDGALAWHTVGSIAIRDADYARSGIFALALESGNIELDLRYQQDASGDARLQGELTADLGPGQAELGEKTRLNLSHGRVALRALDAARAEDSSVRISGRPDADLHVLALSGPIEISVDQILQPLVLLQRLSAAATGSTPELGLGDFGDRSIAVPASDVEVEHLTVADGRFALSSTDGQVELDLGGIAELAAIEIEADERRIDIENLRGVVERFRLAAGEDRLSVGTAGRNELSAGSAKGPLGEVDIAGLQAAVQDLALEVAANSLVLQLGAIGQGQRFSGFAHETAGLPEVELELEAARAALGEGTIEIEGRTLSWRAEGSAAGERINVRLAKGAKGELKLERLDAQGLQAAAPLELGAETLALDGLSLFLTRSLMAGVLAGDHAASATGEPEGDQNRSTSGAAGQKAVDVAEVQRLLTELGYAPGPQDGLMGPKTAAAIQAFQRDRALTVDGRATPRLLAALKRRLARSTAGAAATRPPQADAGGAVPFGLRLGQVSVGGGPVIRFSDDLIDPPVAVEARIRRFELRGLDLDKAERPTRVTLLADVNEFTQLEVEGEISGLGPTADLDLTAKLDDLQLATYSPYVTALSGVHLDSGRLDAEADVIAAAGGLDGNLQLELANIAFQPLTEKEADSLTDHLGVPLMTAVDLLQDAEGRIALTLPIAGTVAKPEVDLAPAVNKAIGSALTRVFPPTLAASILTELTKGGESSVEVLEFPPGSSTLTAAAKGDLEAVTELLAQRPKLSVKMCGRATARDMSAASQKEPAVEKDLAQLAVNRAQALRRYLIEERGIDSKRAAECRSTFADDDPGPPRVEIRLSLDKSVRNTGP